MSQNTPILYFAYGSNLSTKKMDKWSMNAEVVSIAHLNDWSFAMNKKGKDGFARATIIAEKGEQVWGVVYRIHHEHMQRLDQYEGLGHSYRAEWLEVVQPTAEILRVYVYIGIQFEDGLAAHDWYCEYILSGAREHHLPEHYIKKLEAILPVSSI